MGLSPANSGSQTLSGTAGGDLTGTYPNPTLSVYNVTGLDTYTAERRYSWAATMPRYAVASGSPTAGVAYQGYAVCRKAGVYTQVRFFVGPTAFANSTYAKVGVLNRDGTLNQESADFHTTLNAASASAALTVALANSVTLTLGQSIYLCFGSVAHSQGMLFGIHSLNPSLEGLMLSGDYMARGVAGWTAGSVLPPLNTADVTSTMLLLELLP